MKHVIEYEEDDLFLYAEAMLLIISAIISSGNAYPMTVVEISLTNSTHEILTELLKKTLRTPLKNKSFREKFNEHFENHPDYVLRTTGVEILNEALVWES